MDSSQAVPEPTTYANNPEFVPDAPFLSVPALREVLDARPIVCVDVLFVSDRQQTLWLPTRIRKPAEGLWFVGGMLKRSETFERAAQRFIERDTSLVFDSARLSFLSVNRFVWDYRQDEPSENGRVDVNFCYAYRITDDEAAWASAHLNPDEHDTALGLQSFNRDELVSAIAQENPSKQVLLDYYDKVYSVSVR